MIILPWPNQVLSPNSRSHWSTKAVATKNARFHAAIAAKLSGVKILGDGLIDLHITFHPPNKRKRDLDNMLSSNKAHLDGIAAWLEVDDSRFRLHLEIDSVIKGGKVTVKIKER